MKRILAVDDDQTMVEYYKALLSEAGYEVAIAMDATAAVIRYKDLKPDLVILDVQMPAGGGEQVFDITRDVLGAGVPVIFVTGLPDRAARLMTSHAKVRVFNKPVKSDELLSCVAALLGGASPV
ncbi:MAG: response regulator transcription factor [Elusimicrobia bacterium]|nr:response regulator transcription factor [Elusimicrobiota bacterium]